MTRVARKRPDTLRELVGRPVQVLLAASLPDAPKRRGRTPRRARGRTVSGHRVGIVRDEVWADGVLESLVVQFVGGERVLDGASYSARCQGDRVRVLPREVRAVLFRRKSWPLADWLTPAAAGIRPSAGKSRKPLARAKA